MWFRFYPRWLICQVAKSEERFVEFRFLDAVGLCRWWSMFRLVFVFCAV